MGRAHRSLPSHGRLRRVWLTVKYMAEVQRPGAQVLKQVDEARGEHETTMKRRKLGTNEERDGKGGAAQSGGPPLARRAPVGWPGWCSFSFWASRTSVWAMAWSSLMSALSVQPSLLAPLLRDELAPLPATPSARGGLVDSTATSLLLSAPSMLSPLRVLGAPSPERRHLGQRPPTMTSWCARGSGG